MARYKITVLALLYCLTALKYLLSIQQCSSLYTKAVQEQLQQYIHHTDMYCTFFNAGCFMINLAKHNTISNLYLTLLKQRTNNAIMFHTFVLTRDKTSKLGGIA